MSDLWPVCDVFVCERVSITFRKQVRVTQNKMAALVFSPAQQHKQQMLEIEIEAVALNC